MLTYSPAQLRCLSTSAITIIVGVMLIAMGWGQGWYWLVSWGGPVTSKVWTIGTFVALAAGLGETTRPAPIRWFAPAMAAIASVLCGWSMLANYTPVPFPEVYDPTTRPGEVPGLMSPSTALVGLIGCALLVGLHRGCYGVAMFVLAGLSVFIPLTITAGWIAGHDGLARYHSGVPMAYPTVALTLYLSLGGFLNALHYVAAREKTGGENHAAQRA